MNVPRAGYVGLPKGHAERGQVLLYRLDVGSYEGEEEGGVWLHLFAETRYRLWVNGVFAASGPARFVQSAPLYDSIDVGQYLGSGSNCIAVEVYHYGCSSFQTMPGGRDGFIAWGGGALFDFSTPGAWKVRTVPGWARDSALYTFALNPCEIRDTRDAEDAWYLPGASNEGWEAARPLPEVEIVWGALAARNVPMPLFERATPARVVVEGVLADPGEIFGVHFPDTYLGPPRSIERNLWKAFQFWVFSESDQTVDFWHHWGTYWVNGDRTGEHSEEQTGLRTVSEVSLTSGWNCFCGYVNYPPNTVYWDCLFRLPRGCGLRIAASPEDDGLGRLRTSPLLCEDQISSWLEAGRPRGDADWITCDGDPRKLTPSRLMAWQKLHSTADAEADLKRGVVWVFDFGREVLGHVEIEIEGHDGQLLDVGFDEWRQPDGLIDLYKTNPFVHTVDRYVLRSGEAQKIVGLNSRGGRFVQVVVYPIEGDAAPCRLKGIKMIETRTLKGCEGSFSDGNPVDEAIWNTSVNTVLGCAEDVYSDSPWRERGAYIGDFTVNQLVHRLISPDLSIARRCLQLFGQAQRDDGQFPCVAPAYHRMAHEDFSLILIFGLWENWSITGDVSLVEALWPSVERLWVSSVWDEDSDGLWSADGLNAFIDWGVLLQERKGKANAVLNALRIDALEKSALLADATGRPRRGEEFREEAKRVRQAFSAVLWRDEAGQYAACIDAEGTLLDSTAAHANLLAWVFEIGTVDQIDRVKDYLFQCLDGNFELGVSQGSFAGHIELYFFRYLLSALADRGHADRALALIRQHWGPSVQDGFGTLPECFHRSHSGMGSRCHGWSGYPAVWYTKWVLGLRQEHQGDTDRWILDPSPFEGIDHASGEVPHLLGLIRVEWKRRDDGSLKVKIEAPERVFVKTVGTVALSKV